MAQMVKCLPIMQETRVQSLGQEDILEKEMATHSSILAWKVGLQSVKYDPTDLVHTKMVTSYISAVLTVSYFSSYFYLWNFPGGSDSKVSAYNAGDPGSIPGLRRSSGEGNGNPLQFSCLENPMERESW